MDHDPSENEQRILGVSMPHGQIRYVVVDGHPDVLAKIATRLGRDFMGWFK